MTAGLGIGVITDAVIAFALCYFLRKFRNGSERYGLAGYPAPFMQTHCCLQRRLFGQQTNNLRDGHWCPDMVRRLPI